MNFTTTSDSTVLNHSATPSPTETLTTSPSQTKKKINRFRRESLVSHLPTKLPPTPAGLGEFDDALPAYGVGDNSGGESTRWNPTPPCSPEVSRANINTRYELLRSGHWQARQLPTDEVPASLRCVCDESWGIRCLWHRCEGYFSQEMRNIHDNGQGITIWERPGSYRRSGSWLSVATQEEMRRILELEQQKKRKREQKTLDPLPDRRYRGSSEIAEMQIMTWLNLNIKEPRDFRQTQLYIYGPPKMGKSTLIRNLNNYLSIYYVLGMMVSSVTSTKMGSTI